MSTIRIKRSSVSGNPATLAAGELAYSGLTDNGSNGGDRLYVGLGTETGGNAANHIVIGGKFFTDRLDGTAGVLTNSKALVVDASGKLDILNVDDLTLNANTVSATGTLKLQAGTGNIIELAASNFISGGSFGGSQIFPDADLHLKQLRGGAVNLVVGASGSATSTMTLSNDGSLIVPGTITTPSNGNLTLSPNGTGLVSIAGAYTLPRVDGTTGYTLTTDGAGVVSWSPSSGSLNISGSSGSGTVSLTSQSLTVTGSGAITTVASGQTITVSFNTSTLVATAVLAVSATTATSAATAYALANTGTTYVGRSVLSDSATTATSAAFAYSFNTGTLVTQAVTATSAAFAYSFNTGTLVTTAVNQLGGSVNATTGQFSGITTVTNTTAATSTSTGALQVAGGVGVGGTVYATNMYSNGYIVSTATAATTLVTVAEATKDIQGVVDRTASTISFDDASRTYSIAPVSGPWTYYSKGVLHTVSTTATVAIANTSGARFIKIDPATETLVEGGPVPDFINDVVVGYIYYDAVGVKALIVGDERHGSQRDTTWHNAQHLNVGTVWRSGGSITYTLNSTATIEIGVGTPLVIADEDLTHSITHSATPNGYYQQILTTAASLEVLYLNGTTYAATTATTTPWIAGASLASYNQITGGVGSLVDAAEGDYFTYWLLATNDVRSPVKLVLGRATYSTIDAAYGEAFTDYGLSFAEQVFMYQIVVQTSSTYANTPKIQIVAVRKILDKVATSGLAASASTHNGLTGRDALDTHPIGAITDLQTTLDGKQATLVSNSNIKTVNGSSLVGAGNVQVGEYGTVTTATTFQSTVTITSSAVSASTTTGALQVAGGVGVGGSIFVAGVVTATTFLGNLTGTASTATSAATAYSLANTATTYVGRAVLADSATNLAGGTTGALPYQTSAGVTGFLSVSGASGQVLQVSTITGLAIWGDIDGGTY